MTFESGLNQRDDVGSLLAELIRSTDGHTAALLRLDGTCLGAAGDTAQVNSTLLAALVAEMLSCCSDIAHALGEDRFCTVMQQGVDRHVHVTLVDDAHALVVAFADHRQSGVVRLLSQRTAERIGALLSEPATAGSDRPASSIPSRTSRSVDLLDRIFQTSPETKRDEGAH